MLYDWLEKFLNKKKSKNIAKKRLQFALIYDHLDISEEILGALQKDIVEVISRYFVIEKESLKIDIRRDADVSALMVNTPLLKAVRRMPAE
jgi:cell division topological specificity factor